MKYLDREITLNDGRLADDRRISASERGGMA